MIKKQSAVSSLNSIQGSIPYSVSWILQSGWRMTFGAVVSTLLFTSVLAFSDVSNSHPNADAIHFLEHEGIVSGYGDGTFHPEYAINRAEFTKIIIESANISTSTLCEIASFRDASLGEWFGPYVQAARCQGIINGYSDGTFRPSNNVNYAEAAKIVVETFDIPQPQYFRAPDNWYDPYIDALASVGATPRNDINPGDLLSRGDMAQILYAVLPHDDYENHSHELPQGTSEALVRWGENVEVTSASGYMTVRSTGIPDHETGAFPNRGNPNSISEQNHVFTFSTNPTKASSTTPLELGKFGVALNGIPFDPGAAEFWNNDRSSGWQYEALSGAIDLGLDQNNAHVQPTGSYHYHGVPTGLLSEVDTAQVGYAADGFPIYYGGGTSSYRVKSGTRPSGPGGTYDGTFVADYEYVAGLGNLDACNGRVVNGQYGYFLTDTFPFVPRCFVGTPHSSFSNRGGGSQQPMFGGPAELQQGGEPDISDAAAKLGISVRELQQALGPPPPDFAGAARILGVSESYLRSIMPGPPR